MQIVGTRSENVDLEEFLSRPLFAHLATFSEDGPRDAPLWFLWEDNALWFIVVVSENTFQERVRVDPRCAVGIVDFDLQTGPVTAKLSQEAIETVQLWTAKR